MSLPILAQISLLTWSVPEQPQDQSSAGAQCSPHQVKGREERSSGASSRNQGAILLTPLAVSFSSCERENRKGKKETKQKHAEMAATEEMKTR